MWAAPASSITSPGHYVQGCIANYGRAEIDLIPGLPSLLHLKLPRRGVVPLVTYPQ